MLAITGYNSRIVQELITLLPEGEEVIRISEHPASETANRFVLAGGLLYPKTLEEQSVTEIHDILRVNLVDPMQICDLVLQANGEARICIIGSESGFTWSHNGAYAASKAAIHRYVETKKLGPKQQLVCVSPGVIEDCGMTLARKDLENLNERRATHPKRRFLTALEVARAVHFLLYQDLGYISGTVLRMNGGGR